MKLTARLRSTVDDFVLVIGPAWRRAPWVLVLMTISIALDLSAVLLAAPFVTLLMSQNSAGFELPLWLVALGAPSKFSLEAIGALVAGVFIVKAVISTRLQYAIAWFSEQRRAELMLVLLRSYQHKPYEFHITHNSSELVNRVIWETQYFTGAGLNALMRIFVECATTLVLITVLALAEWRALALLLVCIAIVFVVVLRSVRRATATVVAHQQATQAKIIGAVQQALAGYREIRLLRCEGTFQAQLSDSAHAQAVSVSRAAGLASIPRQAIECTVVCVLVLLVYLSTHRAGGFDGLLTTLGTFAMAAMRLMPASTAILGSINSVRSARPVTGKLAHALRELATEPPKAEPPPIRSREPFNSIELKSVGYHYPNQKYPALSDVNLVIRKGELIGIMGRSGAGKSTLADVLLGFLKPQTGDVLVNQRPASPDTPGLQEYAAYIPQTVYLLDDSIRRNVAFGEPEEAINEERVWNALTQAQLADFVSSLTEGVNTHVGERGVRMSGGQRQRVAIARAIYHRREVIVLDEATSALDAQTEREVISALNHMHGHQTLIVIAHKTSVLAAADRIVRVENGRLLIEERHNESAHHHSTETAATL